MPLTDTAIRNAKPPEAGKTPRKLSDAKGLYLEVPPTGNKRWRFKYRFEGKEKRISLGVYPEVSLKEAREGCEEARKLLRNGVDPSAHRQATKSMQQLESENQFEAVAREWFVKFSTNWAESHAKKIIRRLERDIFPWIGKRPISEITAPEILETLRRIENRGKLETAHRALQNCGQIFRYAIATGRTSRDPAADLKGALPPTKVKHHASITDPKAIGALLRAIEEYDGSLVTRAALKLAPLVFVRPGELRKAEWSEFDLDKAEWRIPASRMKMREQHIVPLSTQAITALEELRQLTGGGRYVFPGARTKERPMSENTVNAALRNLGYSNNEMTGHGFRSMASTLLNEQGWNPDAIERQLAHGERDSIRAAYNFAAYLPERRTMMQAWADYLDGLKAGGNVVSINSRVASANEK